MANSLNEKKIIEGHLLLKEADKCLHTSWLKWKPDFNNAADKFIKAGTAFKVGKSYEQAKVAFLKAANAHEKNHSLYHSGKALEQAGVMLKELKKFEEAADLMKKAASLYQEHGTPDTAALVFVKAAKMCERTNIKKAIELYQSAGELREADDKLQEAAEPYGKVTQLLVKVQEFEEVVNSLHKQLVLYSRIGNSSMQYKVILGLVVVHLSQTDYVAADKSFKDAFEIGGFGTSDEAEAIEELLQAYDKSDESLINSIVRKPLFRNLDNELSKLARDLKPSEEFNISQQHTELRLLSKDIAELHIEESKACGVNQPEPTELSPGERVSFEEDEVNPLRRAKKDRELEGLEDLATLNEKPSKNGGKNGNVCTKRDDFLPTIGGELPCFDGGESRKEFESKAELTEEGPGEKEDDLEEGALC